MKIKLSLLLLLLPFSALAGNPQGIANWSESQALTRAAPATSSSDGFPFKSVAAFRLIVCAVSGQTLTGGTITFWMQGLDGLWGDNPTLAQTVTSGNQCQIIGGDWKVSVSSGRFLPAANGITVSGGTTVTMKMELAIR